MNNTVTCPARAPARHDSKPVVIWCIGDGKAGHQNQLRGLAQALGRLFTTRIINITAPSRFRSLWSWLRKTFPDGVTQPPPKIILCAGHQTHVAALAARRVYRAPIVLLMKPTLPLSWFDLCLVPDHDPVRAAPTVVTTRGAINTMMRSADGQRDERRGLFLIGGVSSHYAWDDDVTAGQVAQIAGHDSHRHWRLTTSRRTPASFVSKLAGIANLDIVPVEKTDTDWVRNELAVAAHVWVTEESVSMVYEALTAGASVGVLPVRRVRTGRVTRGLDRLIADQWVTTYAQWQQGRVLKPPPEPLDEAARCAQIVANRFAEWIACR